MVPLGETLDCSNSCSNSQTRVLIDVFFFLFLRREAV